LIQQRQLGSNGLALLRRRAKIRHSVSLHPPVELKVMTLVSRIPALLVMFVVLAGCQDRKAPPPSAKLADAPAVAANNTAATTPTVASTPLSGNGKVGVRECDAYLTLYRSCIETKIPASDQPRYREAYVQGLSALQKAANGMGNTAKLAESCGMAREAAKNALAKYGCDEF
jgi:hypothetical protein